MCTLWRNIVLSAVLAASVSAQCFSEEETNGRIDTSGLCETPAERVECVDFRVGLNVTKPLLWLRSKSGEEAVYGPENATAMHDESLICVRGKGLVVVMVANSLEYLFRLWPYFVQKVRWALSEDMGVAFRIGGVPDILASTNNEKCLRSPEHKKSLNSDFEKRFGDDHRSWYAGGNRSAAVNSNHHTKMLAALALLELGEVTGLFYVDLDAIRDPPMDEAQDVTRIHDDRDVSILFNKSKQPEMFWRVKGFMFFARNDIYAKLFLRTWLANRCGFKDQYSLWHSTFEAGNRANQCFDYHDEIFKDLTYKEIRSKTERLSDDAALKKISQLSCFQWRTTCPDLKFCNEIYQLNTGFKHKPIPAAHTRTFSNHRNEHVIYQDMFPSFDDTKFSSFFGFSNTLDWI